MNKPYAAVSVIVPCYRCAHTIERAIASVEAQTLPPAELILVDDASGDDTLASLHAIRTRLGWDRVKIVEMPENEGAAAARNRGWEVANQPYLAFLDADDTWHPMKIELQYQYMIQHASVVYTCHPFICTEDSASAFHQLPDSWSIKPITKWRILLSNISPTPSVMLRRDLPFRFAHDLRYSEDYLLWLSIVLSGYPSYHLDVPLVFLHKPCYGGTGLSGQLAKMERGELAVYGRARQNGLIGPLLYHIVCAYSVLKYLRRVVIVSLRAK